MLAWTSWGWADGAPFLGVGGYGWDEVDSREYAEWHKHPEVVRVEEIGIGWDDKDKEYKEYVVGTCTGAFVAANVVATARHCFDWGTDAKGNCFDQNANSEYTFLRVVLYDGSTMRAKVKYCPPNRSRVHWAVTDWALLQTEKFWKHYYNFVPSDLLRVEDNMRPVTDEQGTIQLKSEPGHSDPIDIINLGFGSMRILESSEIPKVRELLKKFSKSKNCANIGWCLF